MHVLYFWEALGTRTPKTMFPGVRHANTNTQIQIQIQFRSKSTIITWYWAEIWSENNDEDASQKKYQSFTNSRIMLDRPFLLLKMKNLLYLRADKPMEIYHSDLLQKFNMNIKENVNFDAKIWRLCVVGCSTFGHPGIQWSLNPESGFCRNILVFR